jgi:hypothetical protein
MASFGGHRQLTRYDERGWRRHVLHDRDGALADERDGHRMGAHAVARDAAGGVGGAQESGVSAVETSSARRSSFQSV